MSIERYEPTPLLSARTDSWTAVVEDVGQLATQIAGTDFVPEPLRGKPAAVAACILRGRELGLPPMLSLSATHVIKGRVGVSAEMMRALIIAAGHQLDIREMKSTRCVIAGRRAGDEEWTVVEWTIDKARHAGLGQGDGWKRYPWAMLLARASAELARAVFPDVVAGLAAVEELDDTTPNSTPPPPPRTTVTRQVAPPPAPQPPSRPGRDAGGQPPPGPGDGPPLPGEPGYDQPTQPPPEPERRQTGDWKAAKNQLDAMHAAFNELGITDRDLRLAVSRRVTGRDIGSSKDLTRDEYRALMDTLARIRGVPDMARELARIAQQPDPVAALDALFPPTPDSEPDDDQDDGPRPVEDIDPGERL